MQIQIQEGHSYAACIHMDGSGCGIKIWATSQTDTEKELSRIIQQQQKTNDKKFEHSDKKVRIEKQAYLTMPGSKRKETIHFREIHMHMLLLPYAR